MNLTFKNKKITGILSVVPENEITFDEEIDNYNFSIEKSKKLKQIMGFDKRRIITPGTTVSDLCVYGLTYLFDNNLLNKDEIDALILVTQSPDHFIPPTSNIIQGKLDLSQNIICLDINQGCTGYIVGLQQAFMLLDQKEINKVVLLNADILSSKVSIKDRNSRPIVGDGASVTIVEKDVSTNTIYSSIQFDGKGADVLIIPAGGFKTPASDKTSVLREDMAGNLRALDHLVMKGDEVFNFVLRVVPPMVSSLLKLAQLNQNAIDFFMFHQPNKFMLKKLADKLKIPYHKMPHNIVENFGNASSTSIPTAITYNIGEKLHTESLLICMAGFGSGLSWGALILRLEKLDFCTMINYKKT